MTTESLMVHALKRGVVIADFNVLSIGMILDYINKYDQMHSDKKGQSSSIEAMQNDFDTF